MMNMKQERHPEYNEGSYYSCSLREILHYVQNDRGKKWLHDLRML